MNKLWVIFKREYISRVKTKGFIIGTVLTPVFIILLSIGPGLLMSIKSEKAKKISVIDLSGIVYQDLVTTMDDTMGTGQKIYQFTLLSTSGDDIDSIKTGLSTAVDRDEIDGYLVIPRNILESNATEFYSKNVANFDENRRYRDAISRIVIDHRLKESNLDPDYIQALTRSINLRTFKITKGGEEKEDIGLSYAVSFIMMMFLYMALILYGTFVMRSVYDEKLSRSVEMVISSCKPFHLMAGKVLGVGAVGLTQYFIWAAVAGLLTLYSASIIQMFASGPANFPMPTIPISVLIYFIIFFVLGYLLYATIYAAVGAMVNSDQDAQQFQFPVMMFIIVAFFLGFYIIQNPKSNLSVIFSLIPFFSPLTMFTRISTQTPPFAEIALSIALLIGTIVLFIWIGGKIFRVGILMYGKRPTLPEIVRWLRY